MSELLTVFKIDKITYSIRATEHGVKRLDERNIDTYTVISNILSLGKEKLENYQQQDKDIMIIDENNQISICFAFTGNKIKIITVIDKADIYVKKNTLVEKI